MQMQMEKCCETEVNMINIIICIDINEEEN